MLPPADPTPELEGTWLGSGENGDGDVGLIEMDISADGEITDLLLDGGSTGSVGTIQTVELNVYAFELSDGFGGFMIVDLTSNHMLYFDGDIVAILELGATALPIFTQADIQGTWNGTSTFSTTGNDFDGRVASSLSVAMNDSFAGVEDGVGFTNEAATTLDLNDGTFGRYQGRFDDTFGTGDLVLLMSADKTYVAGYACGDTASFPDQCSFVFWRFML